MHGAGARDRDRLAASLCVSPSVQLHRCVGWLCRWRQKRQSNTEEVTRGSELERTKRAHNNNHKAIARERKRERERCFRGTLVIRVSVDALLASTWRLRMDSRGLGRRRDAVCMCATKHKHDRKKVRRSDPERLLPRRRRQTRTSKPTHTQKRECLS